MNIHLAAPGDGWRVPGDRVRYPNCHDSVADFEVESTMVSGVWGLAVRLEKICGRLEKIYGRILCAQNCQQRAEEPQTERERYKLESNLLHSISPLRTQSRQVSGLASEHRVCR